MSKETGRSTVRFTVMNDHWQVSENEDGLYTLLSRDDPALKIGPMEGATLAGILAVVSELERHLCEGR